MRRVLLAASYGQMDLVEEACEACQERGAARRVKSRSSLFARASPAICYLTRGHRFRLGSPGTSKSRYRVMAGSFHLGVMANHSELKTGQELSLIRAVLRSLRSSRLSCASFGRIASARLFSSGRSAPRRWFDRHICDTSLDIFICPTICAAHGNSLANSVTFALRAGCGMAQVRYGSVVPNGAP